LARFLEIYDTRLLNHTRPYEGIPEAVRAARLHGRVVVLTNKPVRPSERILEGLGLRDLFEEVIGGDGPLPRKPDPASLFGLMERAGSTAEQTLLIGDSGVDHETAVRARVRCCLATYGFGYAKFQQERLTGTEWFVAHASAIPGVITAFSRT
jgi:phosphoglycolate phosphatase